MSDHVERDIEMVQRHIAEGAAALLRLKTLIAILRDAKVSTELAEKLLARFEDIQLKHEAQLQRLQSC